MLTDFQNFSTGRLTGKFATNSYLNIPPHFKRVTTLGKGKVFPYSLPSVGPGADPGVQAVSPQVT